MCSVDETLLTHMVIKRWKHPKILSVTDILLIPEMFGSTPRTPGNLSSNGQLSSLISFKFCSLPISSGTLVIPWYFSDSSVSFFNLNITGGIPPCSLSSGIKKVENSLTSAWFSHFDSIPNSLIFTWQNSNLFYF